MRNLYFIPEVDLDENQFNELREIIKNSHKHHYLYSSFKNIITSKTIKLCALFNQKKIVSFAIYMKRKWNIDGINYQSISIGYVTTLPEFQGKGFGKTLFKFIESFAKEKNIDFLYLQGIKNFYNKLGFRGFSFKSKFVFSRENFNSPKGRILDLRYANKEDFKIIYEKYCKTKKIYIEREEVIWSDFFEKLSNTFLFFNPNLIVDEENNPIVYFCTTPNENNIIREFISSANHNILDQSISLIFNDLRFKDVDKLEIFSPRKDSLLELAKEKGADFLEFIRPNSSNMIKILNNNIEFEKFNEAFLLQGDNA